MLRKLLLGGMTTMLVLVVFCPTIAAKDNAIRLNDGILNEKKQHKKVTESIEYTLIPDLFLDQRTQVETNRHKQAATQLEQVKQGNFTKNEDKSGIPETYSYVSEQLFNNDWVSSSSNTGDNAVQARASDHAPLIMLGMIALFTVGMGVFGIWFGKKFAKQIRRVGR